MNKIYLESVNSTNTYCNYLLTNLDGLPEHLRPTAKPELPVAVVAKEQYAGRGRLGKSFHSPHGSGVYLSYAYEGQYEESALLKLTVVVASIVHQVLQSHCSESLDIKWINDIYRGSHKIAGILCERVDDYASDRYFLIVGVGVNVLPSKMPSDLCDIAGFLSDSCDSSLVDTITDELISALDDILGECRTDEFADLLEYYRIHCRELPIDFREKLLNE